MKLTVTDILDGPHKVILPESFLQTLAAQDFEAPLIFKVGTTHAGVREFSAQEDTIQIGRSLAQQLNLNIGDYIDVVHVSLPKGSSVTLKVDADLDWKPLLEAWLPVNYTALTKGDVITLSHMGKRYAAQVTNLEPADAVCIIDTDLDLVIDAQKIIDADASIAAAPAELGKQLILGETPRYLELKPEWNRLSVKVEGLVYIGPQYATSDNSYLWKLTADQVLNIDFDKVRGVLGIVGQGTVVIDTEVVNTSVATSEDTDKCTNCHRDIPKRSLVLHESFCRRNNVVCPDCGDLFLKVIPPDHWHCKTCSMHGTGNYDLHQQDHIAAQCECGNFEGDHQAVARHRAQDCPNRLILCRYCKLVLAQAQATPIDIAQGLTGHESYCGGRTADCPICNRHVRVKDMGYHLEAHDLDRKARVAPELCANQNCPQTVPNASQHMGLCNNCYGTVYTSQNDPDGSKLRARIERKYVIQLTRGCGNSWCTNSYCATGHGAARKMAEVMPIVKELLASPGFYFCVDQVMSRKAMFLQDSGDYAREWRGMAISRSSTEAEAERWLQLHAPKLSESVPVN